MDSNLAAHYRRLFAYDSWANTATLASVVDASPPPEKARQTLAHIVGTLVQWLARIRASEPKLAVWPDLDLAQIADELEHAEGDWRAYLDLLTDDELHRLVSYRNSKGETFESKVDDILQHVSFHGAYHRGQIAAALRQSGAEPVYTDFIHAVRQRFIL